MDDEKALFAARLNELCSDAQMPSRGRQSALASLFKVTPNAARKWLLGIGLPEMDVAIAIAKWGDVNLEWLMTGRGPKHGTKVPTRALVLDEMLRKGTPEERKELVNYIKYRVHNSSSPAAEEELARYDAALQSFVTDPNKRQ
jgi:hypothetical protein